MARKPKSETMRNSSAVNELRVFVDGLVDIAEQQQDLKDRAAEIAAHAKATGFDVKALKKVVKEKLEDDGTKAKRIETEEIADVYRAALGMLDGTPLGDATRERLSRDLARETDSDEPTDETRPTAAAITAEAIVDAREQGRQACRDGKLVTDNPFTARDPRRAAWDEGWCFEAGSDGMDIPEAFRRRKPAKDEPAKDDDAGEGEE
ncbi:MAG: hypothetical protein H6R00_3345 [Proteobacteria bacterium]|nr:hypothetical protein [Pseudomonadota bacterium]